MTTLAPVSPLTPAQIRRAIVASVIGKLHEVVRVPDLPDPDGRFPFGVQGFEGRTVRAAPVDGDGLRLAVAPDRLLEEAPGRAAGSRLSQSGLRRPPKSSIRRRLANAVETWHRQLETVHS